jgi:uncharacterized membrane protein
MTKKHRSSPASGPATNVEQVTARNVQTVAEMERLMHRQASRGEYLADRFAAVVGSWSFIVIQGLILALWMVMNVIAWFRHWDPYPFILLNLGLSFQAAFAGPIIMMSQNRQARIADHRNQLDLQINLLSEQENTEMLRMLHAICEHLKVPIPDVPEVQTLEQETKPSKLFQQIAASESTKKKPRTP